MKMTARSILIVGVGIFAGCFIPFDMWLGLVGITLSFFTGFALSWLIDKTGWIRKMLKR